MFLWLKLLTFGFAFLDTDIFVTGQMTPNGLDISDPPIAPTIIATASKSSSTIPVTDTSTIAPSSRPVLCDRFKNISVTYEYNFRKFTACVNITENETRYLYPTSDGCYGNLTECSSINIYVIPCPNENFTLYVPPAKDQFNLVNITEVEEADTSISLRWTYNRNFDCTQPLIFSFECKDPNGTIHSKKSEQYMTKFNNLIPDTDYICHASVNYERHLVQQDQINIKTDFRTPGETTNLTLSATETEMNISWVAPSGTFHGFLIHSNRFSEDIKLSNASTNHILQDLQPYEMYDISVRAFTSGKTQRYGKEVTDSVRTDIGKPSKVNDMEIKLEGDNLIKVECKEPDKIYGPKLVYHLNMTSLYGLKSENNSTCKFIFNNLHFMTNYTFKLYTYNGKHYGDAVVKSEVTRYNSHALIMFLIFLIVVTSLALLIVLYKIYDLHKKRSSSTDEQIGLVEKDDEKQIMNVEPIPSEMLLETYKRKVADEGRLFHAEFQSIPRIFSKFSSKDARKPFNQNKNRYVDILPYDYNRVELSEVNGDAGSDYINASYVDGFKEPRKYIAAQGPREETVDDFWRMVWEQKVTVIVMVTRCEEGNRNKCAEYWPTVEVGTQTYGDVIVKINEHKRCPDYIVQKLNITNVS